MDQKTQTRDDPDVLPAAVPGPNADSYCPVCSAPLIQEKCKVVCRSERCIYRLIFNCSEF